jgi:PAS domain S-box-containing protein
MNVLPHRALLADNERGRRARVRQALVGELPGLRVEEAAGSEELVRTLEDRPFDLTVVRHPLPAGDNLPAVLKSRWPDRALLLYGPLRFERRLAAALEEGGDAYFLESGTELPGLPAALRLALARARPGARALSARQAPFDWFASLVDASAAGISLSTLADGCIFEVNNRFLELLGYDRGEVLGRTATELALWVAFPETQIVRMLSEAGRLRRAEVRFRTKAGEVRQGLLSMERLHLDDADGVLSVLDDVTDLRHARAQRDRLIESERRARAEAEQALEQLRESHERLEGLSRRLVELQEVERRALARELHDEVGGILAGLELLLTDVAVPRVHSALAQLSSRVRDLSMDLRPPMLDDLGLVPTLLWQFERYRAQTGIRVRFRQPASMGRLPAPVEMAAFRIAQEALTNVARHAAVEEASVRLDVRSDRIVLRVEDRGLGFEPASASAGASSGLTGMRDRARLAGGRLTVDSAPGRGTRLTAELPRRVLEGRAG